MLENKLEEYKKILNLTNWEIELHEEGTLDNQGETKILYNDNAAIIRIKNEMNDTEKEKTLIHELLHLIHRDELDISMENLSEELSGIYLKFHERSIEQMAKIIYKLNKKV